MRRRYWTYLLLLFIVFGTSMPTFLDAQSKQSFEEAAGDVKEVGQPPLLQKVAIIAILSLMPFAIMLLTSFMKMVVVLSLLRQAIGVQNSPPNQVINGIAILMAVYVMFPTGLDMYNAAKPYIEQAAPAPEEGLLSNQSVGYVLGIMERSREPLRKFLIKNSVAKHSSYFYQLAKQKFPEPYRSELTQTDFIVLIPAYITSQVKAAFEIGVLIYLPFFVIDLVVSNILLAMGMMMLSPLTIALPLKLLLLVMVDGWTLLVEGVVLTYR
jgi:type III secretion protein R